MDAKSGYAKVSCTVDIVFKMVTLTHAQFQLFQQWKCGSGGGGLGKL